MSEFTVQDMGLEFAAAGRVSIVATPGLVEVGEGVGGQGLSVSIASAPEWCRQGPRG